MKIKNILILAGGDGTRFWPMKEKMLTSFLGKPYLQHIIEQLNGMAEELFVVVSKENKKDIEQIIQSDEHIIVQKSPEGMGGAIISCKNKIEGETLILGNDMFDYSILQHLVKKEKDMVLLAKRVNSYFPGGYLRLNGDKIEGIEEKPDPDKTPSNLVRLVADYVKDITLFITAIENTHSLGDAGYEQAITSIIQRNNSTYYEYDGYWYTLKYPWHVLSMMQYFLAGKSHIGKNVKISKTAKIVEPIYIGDNTVIGDYALIRESHIGNKCIIGGYSEVARSYIGEKVMLHRNYVGDSVLDKGVLMGAGAVTANFRFDGKPIRDSKLEKLGAIIGKHTKIGVNATLLPGVKVGKNTIIGPSELVKEDIQNNLFLFNHTLTENKQ